MGKKIDKVTVFLVVILFIGIGIFFYPSISNLWNKFHSSSVISDYNASVASLSEEESREILESALEYNNNLYHSDNDYVMSDEERAGYLSELNIIGDGIMGYIEIPKIDVFLPVYHTSDEKVLQTGVGHVEWTSLPVGGINSHSVLSGHRGLPSAKLFSDLNLMEVGDVFYITVANEKLEYQVDLIQTVLPEDIDRLAIVPGEDLLTLVTCTPYGVNSHRLLVRGKRIDTEDFENVVVTSEVMWINKDKVTLVIFSVFLGLGLAFSTVTDEKIK